MVKKRNYLLFVILLTICYLAQMCYPHSDVYTYYFKDADFKFQILEKDTCDVLILNDGDSIFYSRQKGNYLGVEFFLPVDSNVVYLGPYFPKIYHMKGKNYVINKSELIIGGDSYSSFENEQYWSFHGGCDQGRYTFGVMRNKKFYGSLEPLEWR